MLRVVRFSASTSSMTDEGATGNVVREFRNIHTSQIFDVKFDAMRIVRCVSIPLLRDFPSNILPAAHRTTRKS